MHCFCTEFWQVLKWVRPTLPATGQPQGMDYPYTFSTPQQMTNGEAISNWLTANCRTLSTCTDHRSTPEGQRLLRKMDPQMMHWFALARLAKVWHLYVSLRTVFLASGSSVTATRAHDTESSFTCRRQANRSGVCLNGFINDDLTGHYGAPSSTSQHVRTVG